MIAWKNNNSPIKTLKYIYRQAIAQYRYFDHYKIGLGRFGIPKLEIALGHQSKIASLHNKHLGERCFIICTGPSLPYKEIEMLKNEVTIGCNGLYKYFDELGFKTNYYLIEDIQQVESRAKELDNLGGLIKMAAIYNAYNFKRQDEWLFFNAPRCSRNGYYWDKENLYPQFSKDFASVVHLGSTIATIMLQFAYFLGFEKVYILGLDHKYEDIVSNLNNDTHQLTSENIHQIQSSYFDKNYWSPGDVIGIPNYEYRELGFKLVQEEFLKAGRQIINLNPNSHLNIFPKEDYKVVLNNL